MNKKLFSIFIISLIIVMILGSFSMAAEKQYLFGISQPNSKHPYRRAEVPVIEEWDAQHPEVKCIITAAELSAERQIADVENMMVRGIDILIIAAHQADAMRSTIAEVKAKGIPVFSFERKLSPVSDAICTVYIDAYNQGKKAAEYAVKILGGKGNVVILQGTQGATQTTDRQDGFMDVFKKYPNIKIVADQCAMYQREQAVGLMENILQAHQDIDLVITHDQEMTLGAVQAAKAVGRDKEIIFVSAAAGNKEEMEAIMRGDIAFTNVMSVGFPLILDLSLEYLKTGKVSSFYELKTLPITKENVKKYYDKLLPGQIYLNSEQIVE